MATGDDLAEEFLQHDRLTRAIGTHSGASLFPERLEDWIGDDNPVRVIDVFVDELDLGGLGFGRVEPRATGLMSAYYGV